MPHSIRFTWVTGCTGQKVVSHDRQLEANSRHPLRQWRVLFYPPIRPHALQLKGISNTLASRASFSADLAEIARGGSLIM